MNQETRVWIYARCPGSYTATKNQAEFLDLRARLSGAVVAGMSMDTRKGWWRPGYRELMHRMKNADFNCIYIARLGALGHSRRRLLRFFSRVMKYKIRVCSIEIDLRYQLSTCHLVGKIEGKAAKHGWELPWAVYSASRE